MLFSKTNTPVFHFLLDSYECSVLLVCFIFENDCLEWYEGPNMLTCWM